MSTTQQYDIMPQSDYSAALVGAIRKMADGERLIGHVLHSALRCALIRRDLNQLNELAGKCSELALWPIIHKAVTIVTGGYYTTNDGTRFYRPETSILRYDNKASCYEYIDGTDNRIGKLREQYDYWHNVPLRSITAKTPEAPLTLEPIRKYIAKLQKSGAKWDDRERAAIKAFLELATPILTGDKMHITAETEQIDGINHCAARVSGLDGRPSQSGKPAKATRKTA